MGQRLSGSVAIITGASRGIGQAIAQAYANEGASLCLIARNKHALDELAATLPLSAAQVMTLALDVTDREACFQAVAEVEKHFGRVDTLVNNAGIYRSKTFLEYTAQDFQELLDVNLFGVLHFTQACLPHMQQRQKGSIINIASVSAHLPLSRVVSYSAAKAAVMNLTKFLAREWATKGVRVNTITPGFFPAEQNRKLLFNDDGSPTARTKAIWGHTPMNRFGESKELVGACVFLAAHGASSFVTGTDICVDGGYLSQTI